ncbi:MAG TPA: sigma-70 family RNA polymerase sigma factor [Thermoanaerobaculia bacterium]|jgi:RNA polymerase sigma-70 factor (ECF subfamily)|nr:sigma-70 family RNA polymerase sigma factor [Thermoanaerobaculia bacterium]
MTAVVIDEITRSNSLDSTIRAAQAGDSAAFEELMVLTERRVAQIAWAILGDAEDVKDAVQETFLRLYRFLGRYDANRDFSGWLARITVNVCRDTLHRRKRVFEPLPDMESTAPRADDELIHQSELALLRRAVDSLPPKERLAVILREVEGMRTEEVATALGITVTTVRVQVSRARAKLRAWIERHS